ncbi:hypothetical protein FB475_1649 [Kribbella jejuensis]|uniref:Uncharacterized protein n=1 Tax=Kribbella jejuensis TaxID=236068 RepID=A0A542EQC4_9ACTN|nr:hypothetical protein FB475_1649 [Kribbella jejuensis]
MYVIVLVVAVVVSARVVLLPESRPLDHRLRDLGRERDLFGILVTGLLTLGAACALGGRLAGTPVVGTSMALLGVSQELWFAALAVSPYAEPFVHAPPNSQSWKPIRVWQSVMFCAQGQL